MSIRWGKDLTPKLRSTPADTDWYKEADFSLWVHSIERGQSNKVDGSNEEREEGPRRTVGSEGGSEGANDVEKERRSNEMEKFHTAPPLTCNGR